MSENDPNEAGQRGRVLGPPKLTLVTSGSQDGDVELDESVVGVDAQEGEVAEQVGEQANAAAVVPEDNFEKLRVIEALLFAAPEPVAVEMLARHLAQGEDVPALLEELNKAYEGRGINLVNVGGKWTFRTAQDLSYLLRHHAVETRRLSKAALETLAIIAYHQPVTRAEIEEIRGVTTSVGTLDILLETGWIRLRGRRRAPGRPVTYGTSEAFLSHFGLESIKDLPGLGELKGTGLLSSSLPANFEMPQPSDVAALMPDELPLESPDDEDDDERVEELDLEGGGVVEDSGVGAGELGDQGVDLPDGEGGDKPEQGAD